MSGPASAASATGAPHSSMMSGTLFRRTESVDRKYSLVAGHFAAAVMAMPAPSLRRTIPDWQMDIPAINIARIRTVKTEELEVTREIVNTWIRIYLTFPSRVSCGSDVCHTFVRSLDKGTVLVGEDSKGIAQAFTRVNLESDGDQLYVGEIFVSPWNNTALRERWETARSPEFLGMRKKELADLAASHKVSVEELTISHKGSGAIMMFAICHLAKHVRSSVITLESNTESLGFYERIGMNQVRPDEMEFGLDLSEGLPSALAVKVSEYFLKHTA